MRRSKAPQLADAKTVESWEKRLRDDPKFWGRFSLGLVTEHVKAAAYDETMPLPFVALEYLLVVDEHLRGGVSYESVNANADSASISIPRWVFNALVSAHAHYLEGGKGTTLIDAFVGKVRKQGGRSHSPSEINRRRRDFTLTFKVIMYCLSAAKTGNVPTLNDAFESVAEKEAVSRNSVERAYRENMPILRPYLKRMGAPILFPD